MQYLALITSPKSRMCFSMFTSLLIESKETLETLKIVRFSPCPTRTNKNPNKITLSKIGLRLSRSSHTGVLDCSLCALDHNAAIDPFSYACKCRCARSLPWALER